MNFTFSGVFGLPKQQVLSSCPKHLCLGLGLCPLSVVFRGQVLRESGEERGLDLGRGAVLGGGSFTTAYGLQGPAFDFHLIEILVEDH